MQPKPTISSSSAAARTEHRSPSTFPRGVKVAVLEKSFLASGATGRSSGLVRMHYDLEQEAALAWESFQWFRDWKETRRR